MIRESLYFSFAGRKSTDFGILNVGIDGGLYEEQLTANTSINEVYVPGNDTPYYIGEKKDPLQFQLRFHFEEGYNDRLIDEIIRWLKIDVNPYEPLFFSENIDRVFYAKIVDSISLIHNGLKQGYINLTVRCDSPYTYSQYKVTPWHKSTGSLMVELGNRGHFPVQPQIWIQKVGNGNISISNISNGNEEFKFTNLLDKEELYIDCKEKIIDTNLPGVYRYDNFNDNFISLPYGKHTLQITGKANVKFQYRYIYS